VCKTITIYRKHVHVDTTQYVNNVRFAIRLSSRSSVRKLRHRMTKTRGGIKKRKNRREYTPRNFLRPKSCTRDMHAVLAILEYRPALTNSFTARERGLHVWRSNVSDDHRVLEYHCPSNSARPEPRFYGGGGGDYPGVTHFMMFDGMANF
jgi:hypothetical protein